MTKIRFAAAFLSCGLFISVAPSQSVVPKPATPSADQPRLEVVAETRLLMEGLTKPNFDGLNKKLAEKPADVETWTHARGQALIIAETGNLLMMRPPKGKPAQQAWMTLAADLRAEGAQLARAVGEKDYPAATAGMATLANSCNRCHEKFGEKTRVAAFGQQ